MVGPNTILYPSNAIGAASLVSGVNRVEVGDGIMKEDEEEGSIFR